MQKHLEVHVGLSYAQEVASIISYHVPTESRILYVGTGFGSFIIVARRQGYQVFGLEISWYDFSYASKRIVKEATDIDEMFPFICSSGTNLPFSRESFDIVTLLNVHEPYQAACKY